VHHTIAYSPKGEALQRPQIDAVFPRSQRHALIAERHQSAELMVLYPQLHFRHCYHLPVPQVPRLGSAEGCR
jgi:hypothetical protein